LHSLVSLQLAHVRTKVRDRPNYSLSYGILSVR
jgi:hypothetical protein